MKVNIERYLYLLLLVTMPIASLPLMEYGVKISVTNVIIMIYIIMLFIYVISGKIRRQGFCGTTQRLVVYLLSISILLSILNNLGQVGGSQVPLIIGAISLFFIGCRIVRKENNLVFLQSGLLAGVMVSAIAAILHYWDILPLFEFEKETASRVIYGAEMSGKTGFISARGDNGIWLLGGIGICFLWILDEDFSLRRRVFALLCAAIILFAIYISLSRSSWLAAIVYLASFIPLYFLINNDSGVIKAWKLIFHLLFWVFTVVAGYLILEDFIWRNIEEVKSMSDLSIYLRVVENMRAIKLILDSPLLGHSTAEVQRSSATHHITHNTFLVLASYWGVITAFIFISILLVTMKKATLLILKGEYREQKLFGAVCLSFILGSVVELMLYNGLGSKWFWLLLGLYVGALYRNLNGSRNSAN